MIRIGLVVQMIAIRLKDSVSSSGQILSPGVLRSSLLLHVLQLKLSIEAWPPLQLSFVGFSQFLRNSTARLQIHLLSGVITSQLSAWLGILCFMAVLNTLRSIDVHFIKEKVVGKHLLIQYVNTTDQVADMFTKGLHPRRLHYLKSKLSIVDYSAKFEGRWWVNWLNVSALFYLSDSGAA